MEVILACDTGTSEDKGAIMPLGSDFHPKRIISHSFPTLGKIGEFTALPGDHLGVLREPHPYQGVYKARAREFGARLHRNSNIYNDPVYLLYVFGMVADLLEKAHITEKQIDVMFAGFGFPVSHKEGQAGQLRSTLLHRGKPWTVQKQDGRAYSVTFHNVVCETQPYYMVVDQIFTWQPNGTLSAERGKQIFANGPLLFGDLGSNSNDWEWVPLSLANSENACSMGGTFNFFPKLAKLAYEKTHQDLTEYDLMYQVFRKRQITLNGVTYDFSQEIPLLYQEAVKELEGDIDLFLRTLKEKPQPYAMRLGGGGVINGESYFRQIFSSKFPGGVQIVEDDHGKPAPVWSIVRGMVKKSVIEAQKAEVL